MTEETTEDYQLAGELFGLLEAEIKFGRLSMLKEGRTFVYQWRSEARGRAYGAQLRIHIRELRINKRFPVNDFATNIVEGWKRDYRKALEEPSS